jgi:carbohydrate kinase (thermoresistant glucokinase family)
MLVVIMGVAGSGKTSVGRALASELGWLFVEGDLFHSQAAIEKMRHGIALMDADRAEWLSRLHHHFFELLGDRKSAVISCSALKKRYRDDLRLGIPPQDLQFVFLDVSPELARERMHRRIAHFMPESLMTSQFEALEPPTVSEEAVWVDGKKSIPEVITQIKSGLRSYRSAS